MTSPISGAGSSPVTAVDGLVSGLNTTQLINQLMQAEASQQTVLKNRVGAEQARIAALQSVNSKLAAIATAATALTKADTWQAATATSSHASVTATAAAGASPGTYTFDVTSIARPHTVTVNLPGAALAVQGSGFDITIGSDPPVHFNPGTDDAEGVVLAVNSANMGVKASLINSDQGPVVQFTSDTVGAASAFTVTGLSATPTVLTQGSDAQITVGDPQAGGYSVSSPTNSFTGLFPGVTLTASAVQSGVTVTVGTDAAKIADAVSVLITAANGALTEIGKQSAYGSGGARNAPLAGTHLMQRIQQSLLSAVSSGSADYGSYATAGIGLDSNGQLTFDREKFLNAHAADPTATQNLVSGGLAAAVNAVAKTATDPISGTVTLTIQGANDRVRSLNNNIADWSVRLQMRQTALQRQFSNLEIALGKLRNQSTWLAGQLAGITNAGNTGSTSSSG